MRNITKFIIVTSLLILIICIILICVRVDKNNKVSEDCIIGGSINQESNIKDIQIAEGSLTRKTISIINKRMATLNETYFRPSKQKTLNNIFMDFNTFSETFKSGKVPPTLINKPEDSVINYFSVLQQASNLTEMEKGGCGTIGYAKTPYPIAYDFLSREYKKSIPFDDYVKSFEGIGHINLINILPISTSDQGKYKFFIELEILEGSSVGATTFSYYTGEVDIINENGAYYIDSYSLTPEDFFCAAYHGWAHDAELYVETIYGNWYGLIMKQYAPQEDDYKKDIVVDGTDENKYMFEFAKLTNGTDLLINTLIKSNDNWIPVEIHVNKNTNQSK